LITTADFAPTFDFLVVPSQANGLPIDDFDNNGKPDLISKNRLPSNLSVFHNTGTIGKLSFTTLQDCAIV
jgi:hypothetical protein